jgi:hypothetical protein
MNTHLKTPATYGRNQAPRHLDQAVVYEGLPRDTLRVYN